MIRTFGTVIGISVGIVGLVFLTVVALLYRSGDSTLPETALKTSAVRDSSRIDLTPMKPADPPAKTAVSTASQSTGRSSTPMLSSQTVVQKKSSPVAVKPRSTSSAGQIKPAPAKGTMSTEEYVERETYYLNKIDQSSDQVLQRSSEINQQLSDLKAQLEALQRSN